MACYLQFSFKKRSYEKAFFNYSIYAVKSKRAYEILKQGRCNCNINPGEYVFKYPWDLREYLDLAFDPFTFIPYVYFNKFFVIAINSDNQLVCVDGVYETIDKIIIYVRLYGPKVTAGYTRCIINKSPSEYSNVNCNLLLFKIKKTNKQIEIIKN